MFDIEIVEPEGTAAAAATTQAQAPAAPVTPATEAAQAAPSAEDKLAKLEADYAALAAKVAAQAPAPAAAPAEAPAAAEADDGVDYFLDPKAAIEKAASAAVDKALTNKATYDAKVREEAGKVAAAYPDAGAVMASAEFGAFLKANPALASAYETSKNSLNGEGIANTIGLFKKLAGSTAPAQTTQETASQEVVNLEGGASGATGSGKVWSRAEIQRIAMNDPDRYDALGPEIARAYAENRVTA